MAKTKRNHTASFKAKVALEAIKEKLTHNQITSKYEVHATQIKRWRDEAIASISECFSKKRIQDQVDQEALIERLYTEIGRLQTQLSWLKKKCDIND